jgi:hypothetical protein
MLLPNFLSVAPTPATQRLVLRPLDLSTWRNRSPCLPARIKAGCRAGRGGRLARNRSLIFYTAVRRQNRSPQPFRPVETRRRRSEVNIQHFPPPSPYEARRGGNPTAPIRLGKDLAGYFVLFRLVSSHFGPMSPRGRFPRPFFGRSNRPKPLISV